MASDCSLIKPQNFAFNAVGNNGMQINNRCSGGGESRIVFDIDMPTGANSAIANIQLVNTRTKQNTDHSIAISEYKCTCSTLCIDDSGLKKNNKHIITVVFNGLIPGDRYSGSACLEYIS